MAEYTVIYEKLAEKLFSQITKYVASRGGAGVSFKSVHTQAEQWQSTSYSCIFTKVFLKEKSVTLHNIMG